MGVDFLVLVPPSAGMEEEGKEGLSADALEILSDLGARVVFTEGMPKLSPGLLYPQLGGEIWIKLFLWQLEEYESIFCLDADSILLHNLDQVLLASLAWKSQGVHLAVREYTTSDYFFGGYFIVFPSRNTYEEMMKELVGGNDIFNHAEMDFLNLYFGTRKRVALEEAHFCMSARLKSTEHLSHCKAIDFMSCGALKWKPWHRLSRLVGKTVCGDEDPFSQHFLDVVEIWRELFSSSKQSLRPSALLLFEELMKMTSKYYDDSSKTVHGKDDDGNVSIYFEHHDRFM
uniref:Uncharacterized protein n=1 Tax=Heterosigma akashiwo TaxID=2829 RepID=A0A7S3Y5J2_HETAK